MNQIQYYLAVLLFTHSLVSMEYVQFAQTAIKNYQQVGAVAPFSKYTAQSMIDAIDRYIAKNTFTQHKPLRFLEVGAGNGALSDHFFKYLTEKKIPFELDLVELDKGFSEVLRDKFKKCSEVCVHEADVIIWDTKKNYDIVVSTLPFNNADFSPNVVKNIIDKMEKVALPDGLFLSVEYIGMGPIGYYFLWDDQTKESYTKKHLILYDFREKHNSYTKRVILNIPPTYVYVSEISKKFVAQEA